MKHETFVTTAEKAQFALAEHENGAMPTLKGYAIVFNQLSGDRGGYKVRIRPRSVQWADEGVQALYNHQPGDILGASWSRTLRLLPEDNYGVPFELDLPNTTVGRDVAELVKRGDIQGMSFGTVPLVTKDVDENGQRIRDYMKQVVDEITVTGRPAFKNSTVDIKRYADMIDRPKLSQLKLKIKIADYTHR